MTAIVVEAILSLAFFLFKKMGVNEDKLKWLNETSKKLHEKGFTRKKFIVELEKDSEIYLRDKLNKGETNGDKKSIT